MMIRELLALFPHESFQRLVGLLGIAVRAAWQQSNSSLQEEIEALLQKILHACQTASGDKSQVELLQTFSRLLVQIRLDDDGSDLIYTTTDLEWLWRQIEDKRYTVLLVLLLAAVALAAQTNGELLTPSDLARISGEGEATWRQRLQRSPDRFLAVKVGPGGTWVVPRAVALARGIRKHHR